MDKPRLLVLTGPGGSGKSTLAARLCRRDSFVRHLSVTTAPAARRELDEPEYVHVSPEEFDRRRAAGQFAEWLNFPTGVRYGFPHPQADPRDRILVGITSSEGVVALRAALADKWDLLVILVDAPDGELDQRVGKRGDSAAEAAARALLRQRERAAGAYLVIAEQGPAHAERRVIEYLATVGWVGQ